MRVSMSFVRAVVAACLVAAPVSLAAAGQTPNYDEIYAQFLETARKLPPPDALWMADLASDPIAHHVNDLVTVRVMESLSATGTADSNVGKSSKADLTLPTPTSKLFSKLVPASSDTSFKGAGSTTRAGDLSAVVTGRVAEVLPNGDLFIESVREITINDDRQVVVLTGVARVADISPGNVVLSTSLGELQIRYFGRGLMKDNLSPGWLVRILNKIF